jgi:hypothetical protein
MGQPAQSDRKTINEIFQPFPENKNPMDIPDTAMDGHLPDFPEWLTLYDPHSRKFLCRAVAATVTGREADTG